MTYIDGFMAAVPQENREAYRAHAAKAAEAFRDHGALRVVECWGDDVPHGKLTDMHMAVKAEPSEAICFSWVEWPSKAKRDEAWPKIMNDPRMTADTNPMPFDGKRIIYGGFTPLLDVKG